MISVLGIDPGYTGALALISGKEVTTWPMPLVEDEEGKHVDFDKLHNLIWQISSAKPGLIIFVERAYAGGMGLTSAFNYGKAVAAIEIALSWLNFKATFVPPATWCKVMHEGLDPNLKAKAKSIQAVAKMPKYVLDALPKKRTGALKDGPVDAVLIAMYGLRVSE